MTEETFLSFSNAQTLWDIFQNLFGMWFLSCSWAGILLFLRPGNPESEDFKCIDIFIKIIIVAVVLIVILDWLNRFLELHNTKDTQKQLGL